MWHGSLNLFLNTAGYSIYLSSDILWIEKKCFDCLPWEVLYDLEVAAEYPQKDWQKLMKDTTQIRNRHLDSGHPLVNGGLPPTPSDKAALEL